MGNLLKLVNISKSFGHVVALDKINLEINLNEIVGLLGDNGAGKSTLIKIINGYHRPTSGEYFFKGEKINDLSVTKARNLGIETCYQEKALVEQQTLWRNIFIGRDFTTNLGFTDIKKMRNETMRVMRNIGFTGVGVDSDTIVKNMSGGEKQGIAIARSLFFKAEVIILDEPTMSLSIAETRKVLGFIESIKKEGKTCIFIDHNIYHVYPVCDRIIVLDRGKIVGQFLKEDISLDKLIDKLYSIAVSGRTNNDTK